MIGFGAVPLHQTARTFFLFALQLDTKPDSRIPHDSERMGVPNARSRTVHDIEHAAHPGVI